VLAHPIQGQVNPATVSGLLNFLFDHLFPEDLEFGLAGISGISRFHTGLFQAHFLFLGDHIILCLATAQGSVI
jgi:hypothetical protein